MSPALVYFVQVAHLIQIDELRVGLFVIRQVADIRYHGIAGDVCVLGGGGDLTNITVTGGGDLLSRHSMFKRLFHSLCFHPRYFFTVLSLSVLIRMWHEIQIITHD